VRRRFLMSSLTRWIRFTLGAGLVLTAFSTAAWAQSAVPSVPVPVPVVPEIDAGSMAGAMTLLTGAVLLLTDRRRKK
jgi:hypothetical protein